MRLVLDLRNLGEVPSEGSVPSPDSRTRARESVPPANSLEWVAQQAFDRVAEDETLQATLEARGYAPLLGWIEDRSLAAAACLAPDVPAKQAVATLAELLRRLLQSAVCRTLTATYHSMR